MTAAFIYSISFTGTDYTSQCKQLFLIVFPDLDFLRKDTSTHGDTFPAFLFNFNNSLLILLYLGPGRFKKKNLICDFFTRKFPSWILFMVYMAPQILTRWFFILPNFSFRSFHTSQFNAAVKYLGLNRMCGKLGKAKTVIFSNTAHCTDFKK